MKNICNSDFKHFKSPTTGKKKNNFLLHLTTITLISVQTFGMMFVIINWKHQVLVLENTVLKNFFETKVHGFVFFFVCLRKKENPNIFIFLSLSPKCHISGSYRQSLKTKKKKIQKIHQLEI